MCIDRFARAQYNMKSKLIDKQDRMSITDEVKIPKFLNIIPDIIKKSITLHLTYDMTYNDIVTKSEQFEAANSGFNSEYTKPGYISKVSRYSNATSTPSTYPTHQPRADKSQLPQNRLVTPGARSTASAGPKDSDGDVSKNTLTGKERMRPVREKAYSWCGLGIHNFAEYRQWLNKEPIRTAAQEMQLQQLVGKPRLEEEHKQKPQVAIREPLDPNLVFVEMHRHSALAPIDQQTIGADLISEQFVYLYKLSVVKIEPKTLATTIEGSKGTVDKTCEVELNCGGYVETRMV